MCGGKGGGGGGTTTVTKSDPPEYVAQAYKELFARAKDVSNIPYSEYSGPVIAGFTDPQISAFKRVEDLQGASSGDIASARSALASSLAPTTAFSQDAIRQYYNPYNEDVIKATMANLAELNAKQQAQLQGDAISKGAWGGDRAGVAAAELARQQGLASAQTLAGLRAQGYEQAMNAFQQQIQNELAQREMAQRAASGYGSLAEGSTQLSLQEIDALLKAGALQQQMAQNILNVPYQKWLARQAYPFQTTQFLQNAVFGLPGGAAGTTSTATSPAASAISELGGLGLAGLGLYGAISGKKRGGRVCRAAGGYLPSSVPNLASGYIPVQTPRGGGGSYFSPWASTGSVAVTEPRKKTFGETIEEGIKFGNTARSIYKGAEKLGEKLGLIGTGGEADFAGALQASDTASRIANFMAPAEAAASGIGSAAAASGDFAGVAAESAAQNIQNFLAPGVVDSAVLQSSVSPAIDAAAGITQGIPNLAETAAATAAETSSLWGNIATGLQGAGLGLLTKYGLEALGVDKTTASVLGGLATLAFFLLNRGGRVPYKSGGRLGYYGGGTLPYLSGEDDVSSFLEDSDNPGLFLEPSYSAGYSFGNSPLDIDEINVPDVEYKSLLSKMLTKQSNAAPSGAVSMSQNVQPAASISYYTPTNLQETTTRLKPTFVIPSDVDASDTYKPNKWEAMMAAGLGMMSGTSPNPFVNIGQGGLMGLEYWMKEKKAAEESKLNQEKMQRELAKLINEAEWRKKELEAKALDIAQKGAYYQDKLGVDREKIASLERYRDAMVGINRAKLNRGNYDIFTWEVDTDQGKQKGISYFDKETGEWKGTPPPEGASVYKASTNQEGKKKDDSLRIREKASELTARDLEKDKTDVMTLREYAPEWRDRLLNYYIDSLSGKEVKYPSIEGFKKEIEKRTTPWGTKKKPYVVKSQDDINNAPSGSFLMDPKTKRVFIKP